MSFLLSLAEKIEDWDYAEKKAKDLKKIKGYKNKINLSNYTLQKGVVLLDQGNISEAEKFFKKQLVNHLNFGDAI